MPDSRISQIPIFAIGHAVAGPTAVDTNDTAELSPADRWERCRISADIASALDIPADGLRSGEYQVRVGVTEADVNVLFNPGYLEYLGKSESFVVGGVASGSQRVEIYPNSGPGAKDGGVFRLFGGGNPFAGADIPTNARVSLWREELGARRADPRACGTEESLPGRSTVDLEPRVRAGVRRPRKARWLRALRAEVGA